MNRYELRGSGVGMIEPTLLIDAALKIGATNIHTFNLDDGKNKLKTIRFDCETPAIARQIAKACSDLDGYGYCKFNAYGVNKYS